MAEYIEREEYCEKHCRCSNEYCDKESCPIWKAPAADVAPVVHGRWIRPHWKNSNYCYDCSECGGEATHRDYQWAKDGIYPICPNCGARMDGGLTMAEYIERTEALEITTRTCGDYAAAWSEIRKLPAADVAPVVHGRWIEKMVFYGRYFVRSNCGARENKYTAIKGYYCWRCGAKMDGDAERRNT